MSRQRRKTRWKGSRGCRGMVSDGGGQSAVKESSQRKRDLVWRLIWRGTRRCGRVRARLKRDGSCFADHPAVFHGWCSGSTICVGSTAAEGARRSKGQAGKGRSRRAKALMSPVEGLEGGEWEGEGGGCGSVEGCKASVNARRPHSPLTHPHHLHSSTCTCPHSLASPTVHW